jgi:Spy/CpxP family protein refolding chaperone
MIKLVGEMKEHRNQLRQVEEATSFDEESVRAISTAIANSEIEMTVLRIKAQNQINSLFSVEQLEQLKSLRAEAGRQSPSAGTYRE